MFGAGSAKLFYKTKEKKIMKKITTLLLTLAFTAIGLTGCKKGKDVKIGILQPVEHEALGAAYEGFKEGLKKQGYDEDKVEFVYRNGGGKEADITSFAKDLVSTCDMYLGIGTGASQALKSAADEKGKTNPLLFTAVTDPVEAGLVASLENGKGFVTGTSDMQPLEAQIELIEECFEDSEKDVDKVGIIYTSSEVNSVAQADAAEKALKAKDIEVVRKTCTGPSDVSSTAMALASVDGLDAIYIPTDNNIAANTDAIKTAIRGSGILVVTGEEGMMKGCGHVTLSINYRDLGIVTGEMAADILKNDLVPGSLAVKTMTAAQCDYVMSSKNCADANVTLPASVIEKCKNLD